MAVKNHLGAVQVRDQIDILARLDVL